MKVLISGKHMDIGDSFTNYIKDAVEHKVMKFFEDAVSAHVTISKHNHLFHADIIVNDGTGTGIIMKSNCEEGDAYRSFDGAINKLTTRLSRYKSRIKNHHKRKMTPGTFFESTKYVISQEEEPVIDAPVIIAEKKVCVEKMCVADAVMQMDLMNLPALMFINSNTNTPNVVYYRVDGNISWIDGGALTA